MRLITTWAYILLCLSAIFSYATEYNLLKGILTGAALLITLGMSTKGKPKFE